MGFFDKLLGRDPAPPNPADAAKIWDEGDDAARNALTRSVLEQAAVLAKLADATVYAEKHDGNFDLRGTVHGLPIRVQMDSSGSVRDLEVKHAKLNVSYIDLEYDAELPAHGSTSAPAWSPGEQKLFLAPRVYLEGTSAEKEAAAFRRLPAELQARVLALMPRANILYFRSRYDSVELTIRGDGRNHADPVRWLADMLVAAGEVAVARGARPPGTPKAATAADDDVVADAPEAAQIRARAIAA